jgi:hypothetical protein
VINQTAKLDFSVRKDSFRLQINLNLNENLKIFLDKFPKFDIKYTAFYRKKKEKNGKIQWEENKMMRNLIFKFNSIIY